MINQDPDGVLLGIMDRTLKTRNVRFEFSKPVCGLPLGYGGYDALPALLEHGAPPGTFSSPFSMTQYLIDSMDLTTHRRRNVASSSPACCGHTTVEATSISPRCSLLA